MSSAAQLVNCTAKSLEVNPAVMPADVLILSSASLQEVSSVRHGLFRPLPTVGLEREFISIC